MDSNLTEAESYASENLKAFILNMSSLSKLRVVVLKLQASYKLGSSDTNHLDIILNKIAQRFKFV